MEIRVLGPLGASEAGRQIALGGRRQRSVLAGLVVHAGETVSTSRLIDIVWGENPPPTARKSLQTYVSRLRRSLGDGLIVGVADGYALRAGVEQLDVLRFERLVEEGRRLLAEDPARAWQVLTEALGLWRGTLLSDVEVGGDLLPFAERLQETRVAAVEERIDAGLVLGYHGQLIGELRAQVDAFPLRERLRGQLGLALYRSGRHAEALACLREWGRTLADELGLEPSSSLRQLEVRILRQDPALDLTPCPDTPETAAGPNRNPYKGLRAFGEADSSDFFGRDALVEELVARVDGGVRFLALVGPSGAGKSSIALAGLVPALRQRSGGHGRLVARMNPASDPFAQLRTALAQAAGDGTTPPELTEDDELGLLRAVLSVVPDERTELLLVIDQFEELLTGTIAARTVRAFVRHLTEALEDPHGQLLVVVTLRSDFFDDALRQADLAELLKVGTVNVPPLTPVELQAAVVRPAGAVGLVVEPELTTELVTETARHPAALPLMQFVLTELTDHAEGGTLTLAALRRAGGIQGTLAERAEYLFSALTPEGQEAARRLFLRLVALTEDGEPTRRVAIVDEVQIDGIDDRLRTDLLDALVQGRLLSYGREALTRRATVEVTHEAVLRAWPRCERWIEAARADIRIALDVGRAAADWIAADRSPDYLLTGSRLTLVEAWATTSEVGHTPVARGFVEASLARRGEEERAEAARTERERTLERRALRRLRISVGVLAVLVGATTVLTGLAVASRSEAGRQQDAALFATTEILVRQLSYAGIAESGRDPELGLLLGLHAARVSAELRRSLAAETLESLHWGLQELRVPYPVGDGDHVVLVGAGGPRGAYRMSDAELVALAQRSVDRELTELECGTFLGDAGCPTLPTELAALILPSRDSPAAAVSLAGTRVSIAGSRPGLEALAWQEELASFTESTGIEVTYTEASTFETDMAEGRLQDSHDLIVVPQPGWIATEAAAGRLVDIGVYLPHDRIVADYGHQLASLVTVATDGSWPAEVGHLSAIPVSANMKSLIWYDPEEFEAAGYQVPKSWEELLTLSDQIVADGDTPWCFAEASGLASGWPATDWVEELLLTEAGPEAYDAWVAGELAFSSPPIRQAFERLGQLAFTDGYVHGGIQKALNTPVWEGLFPLSAEPPGCWLHHQASFAADWLDEDVMLGEDIATFPTPPINPDHPQITRLGGDFALVYTDRPEVRAVVEYLASPDFGRQLAESRWFLASNRRFEMSVYPETWRQELGAELARAQAADSVRFDGSDLLPPWLGTSPLWNAMTDYLRAGPDSLDEILARLDALEPPPPT
jgi:DNA-binding SARP family transcriptional activator/ABC-type glycerol-3-phosphate transport system substrate-binding protein